MKQYAYYKGDRFLVIHNKTRTLDEWVSAIWLDIDEKELTINYNKGVDISKVEHENEIHVQILDKTGDVIEAYILKVAEKSRDNLHITYKIKQMKCYFDFDD